MNLSLSLSCLPVLDDAVVVPRDERVSGMAPRHGSDGTRVRL